jgi:hypothetical protein
VAERPAGGGRNRGGVGRWKKEQRGKEALTRGTTWPEREREGGERRAQAGKRRRQAGPSWQREGGREVRALGLVCTEGAGPRRPMRGKKGRGREELGRRGEKRGERRTGRPKGFVSPSLLFFFLLYTQTFKQNYLNSNKFEFKSYKLNTRKIMHQHECTNKLTL